MFAGFFLLAAVVSTVGGAVARDIVLLAFTPGGWFLAWLFTKHAYWIMQVVDMSIDDEGFHLAKPGNCGFVAWKDVRFIKVVEDGIWSSRLEIITKTGRRLVILELEQGYRDLASLAGKKARECDWIELVGSLPGDSGDTDRNGAEGERRERD